MSPKNHFKTFYALSLAWQLGFFIVMPIGGFLLLGIFGDRFFGTSPLLLLVGFFVGIAVTLYEAHHLFIPLTHNTEDDA